MKLNENSLREGGYTYILCSSGPLPSCEEMAVLIPHGQVTNPNDGLYSIHVVVYTYNVRLKIHKYIK